MRHACEAVVLGASAGGVEALLTVFSALPAAFSLPVVAILHLPEGRQSELSTVFERRLRRPVREAQDKAVMERGIIYVAGPSYHLSIERDHSFSLSLEPRVHFSRPSIDVLFDSAADAYGAGLAGVLMTGASQDGASGLAAIQQAGGLTVVQDPAEAKVATMPQAALELLQPDHILTLHGIGELLADLETGKC
ncbi:chemotaxis protein CheB [Pseudomonas sp. RIT-PI-S]|uniref:chemotaxis protein CheB n=1 Tax=Pseudomonas sp. RIT-PI-S TaxID=3035295 RepID=UPI0021DB1D32|nr:chemotaxis protein CheB [Pseudomonas sp. RIT-PI-S]